MWKDDSSNTAGVSNPTPTQTDTLNPPPELRTGDEKCSTDQSTADDEERSPDQYAVDDEERHIMECLIRKINGQDPPPGSSPIPVVELSEIVDPQRLTERYKPNEKNEWFFFVRRNQAARYRYPTERTIIHDGQEIGSSRMLEYYRTTPTREEIKADWLMSEYRTKETDETPSDNTTTKTNYYVLYKIYTRQNRKRKFQAIDKGDEVQARGKNPMLGDASAAETVQDPIGRDETGPNPVPVPEPNQMENRAEHPITSTPILGLIEPGENPASPGGA